MSVKFSKKKLLWFVIVVILSLNVQTIHPQTIYIPLNHWVYDYLERLETKQIIQGVLNGTKPLSRMEIARYLAKAHQNFDQLNKVEQDQLNYLNIEFKEELDGLIEHLTPYQTKINRIRNNKYIKKVLPKIVYQNNRNFLRWSEDQFQVFVDPIMYRHRIYNSTDSDKAVAVLDFGGDKTSTNGDFTIQFPVADASNAIIRIA